MASVRVILPPKFRSEAFLEQFKDTAREVGELPLKDFEKTVRYWKGEKPKFIKAVTSTDKSITVTIRVTGDKGKDKFNWIDYGTPRHPITAVNGKTLRFNSGKYGSGSTPGTTAVRIARPAGGPLTFPVSVIHPGIKARNWRELIEERNAPHFRGALARAMREAAVKSGHKMT